MSDSRPIGVFDSGVGGLSVWKEMINILPFESVIYYADNKNCPYGNKSNESIIQLSSKVVDFLLTKDVKSIVVACNTATAAAIDHLRKNYTIPFIGMEPAVKPASLNSITKSIAILATEGTFNGKLFRETSRKYASDVELNIEIGNDLVDIVEKGLINEQSTYNYLKQVVKPLVDKDIDHLVLGCTHFPFLIPVLQKILPENVKIIDPAPAVAKQTFRVLQQKKILNQSFQKPQYDFYSTKQTFVFESMLKDIFGFDIDIHAV